LYFFILSYLILLLFFILLFFFFLVWLFPIYTDHTDSTIHLHNKTLHKLYWICSCIFATFNTDTLRHVLNQS